MESVILYCSSVISIVALVLSILGWRNTLASNVKEFFISGNTNEFKQFRKKINKTNELSTEKDKLEYLLEIADESTAVVSFYDTWALMVRKKHLPLWAFKGIAGEGARHYYSLLEPYIRYRRLSKFSCNYGIEFEKLVNKLRKNTHDNK